MEAKTTIWFDRGREHFYAIPEGTDLPEGELKLHSLRGQVWRVTPESVAGFALSREAATEKVSARMESAWGDLRGAWSRLLDMGEKTAGGVGVDISEGRPELPEDLAAILGMAPGELLTEPGVIREKIRKAMFGEDSDEFAGTAEEAPEEAPAAEPEEDVIDAEVEEPAEEESAPEASLEDLAKKAEETVRGVLNSPEFSAVVSGFGAFLRQAGQKLQETASNLDKEADAAEE